MMFMIKQKNKSVIPYSKISHFVGMIWYMGIKSNYRYIYSVEKSLVHIHNTAFLFVNFVCEIKTVMITSKVIWFIT